MVMLGSGDRYSLGPSGSTTLTRLGELKGEYQAAKKKGGGGGGGSTRALSVCFGIAKDGDTSYRTVYAGNDRGIISEWRLELKGGDDGNVLGEWYGKLVAQYIGKSPFYSCDSGMEYSDMFVAYDHGFESH